MAAHACSPTTIMFTRVDKEVKREEVQRAGISPPLSEVCFRLPLRRQYDRPYLLDIPLAPTAELGCCNSLPQSRLRRFGDSSEGENFPREVPIGKDTPDPNWAMPGFLRESFRRRATELVQEAERGAYKPSDHDPFWEASNWIEVLKLFGKEPTEDDKLRVEFWRSRKRLESSATHATVTSSADMEHEYEKWKRQRLRSDVE